nr:MAG TPA: hypothetical protein [Caudoviricetes sp.]
MYKCTKKYIMFSKGGVYYVIECIAGADSKKHRRCPARAKTDTRPDSRKRICI